MDSRRQFPFKICGLDRHRTFGVVAKSLAELTNKGKEKLSLDKPGVKQTYTVVLEDDGTIVDDEDYFMHLPENTKFMILGSSDKWTPGNVEIKFSSRAKMDSGVDCGEYVDCVDYPESSCNWKILAGQLRQNLALIITMSESDLQELIDVPAAELAKELEDNVKRTEAIQDSLQHTLDSREEHRQAKELLQLYQNACGKHDSEDARETDQVDGPDATTSQTFQLSQRVINTLRQKSSPELSLSNMELQKIKDLQEDCRKEFNRRSSKVKSLDQLNKHSTKKRKL
uniref:DNA fragmentation factor subunit alpha isoform X2 n=1 Tax=Pristiophorus japonicus TaxID=55135 RepID=UPI00398EE7EB